MNSCNKLIRLLVLIADLCLFISPVGVIEFILIRILLEDLYLYTSTRRYYRTYTYTEVPVGTFRSERYIYFFTLIRYLDSYQITIGLPKPEMRNEK